MKKDPPASTGTDKVKKGYNEKNPSQPEGPFPPASNQEKQKTRVKSNAADKKEKEDQD